MEKELVKDWMTREVITINPDMTLPEAHRLMTDHKNSPFAGYRKWSFGRNCDAWRCPRG
jgi:CBS domain-containing protein